MRENDYLFGHFSKREEENGSSIGASRLFHSLTQALSYNMNQIPVLLNELAATFGDAQHKQIVSWPVLKTTDKARLIRTPGGEIWIPIWRWNAIQLHHRRHPDEKTLAEIQQFFAEISATCGESRVFVKRAGKGPTDLSVKIKFTFTRKEGPDTWGTKIWERSATVAKSLLTQDPDGRWTAPRWRLIECLKKDQEKLATAGIWPGLEAVHVELQTAFDAFKKSWEEAEKTAQTRAEEQARREAEQKKKIEQELTDLQTLVALEAELALGFARRVLRLTDLADLGLSLAEWPRWLPTDPPPKMHLARTLDGLVQAVRKHQDYPAWRDANRHKMGKLVKPIKRATAKPRVPNRVAHACTVEWSEWVGPKRSRQRVDSIDENCTVRFFGKKREIKLLDGTEIVKMEGIHLKILEPVNPL